MALYEKRSVAAVHPTTTKVNLHFDKEAEFVHSSAEILSSLNVKVVVGLRDCPRDYKAEITATVVDEAHQKTGVTVRHLQSSIEA